MAKNNDDGDLNFNEYRQQFYAAVTKFYREEKAKRKNKLANFDGEVCISADVMEWTRSYCSISLQFIDENWKLNKWVIYLCSLKEMKGPWDAIVEAMKDWGIQSKISTLTMISDYEVGENLEYLINFEQETNKEISPVGAVYCFSDFLTRMVEYAFREIRDLVYKVRKLWWTKGPEAWHLTSHKLKQAMELWTAGEFSKALADVPSDEEWKKVESVCQLVDQIHQVAEGLFQKEKITSNLYLYHLYAIRVILSEASKGSDSFVGNIAEGMLEKLDKYWNRTLLVLAIPTVLDPRFKMKYIEFVSSQIEGTTESSQVRTVSDAVRNLYAGYASGFSQKANAKSELDMYLEEPLVPRTEDFDVLDWWKSSSSRYPIVSKIARYVLAIPLSLSTSSDAYDIEPRPVEPSLTRLGPKAMNVMACFYSWCEEDK
ncbi:hypothetical protein UlMin_009167 [Ulmus minor]